MEPPIKEEEVVDVQKMKDETIELLKKVFITVSATKKAVTVEERKVISSAYKKMNDIRRDLVRNPPDAADDIIECRSKIETHISDICNKLSNLTVKDSYRRHLHHFTQTSKRYGQPKRKASTKQLPETAVRRKQNSIKTQQLQQEDTSMTEEEIYLEKLILEQKDYDETARFIETSLRMHTSKEDREVLRTAYKNLIRVDVKLHIAILSIEENGTYEGKDPNMINNHRAIILKGLSDVCDKVSDLTIKEAYRHHHDEFKTGAKPKKYTQMFINQKESQEIFFDMKGGSGSGSSKSMNSTTKQLPVNEYLDVDDFHDHSKCIEEEEERLFPRYGRIGNWDPKYEGTGPDLLHLPKNHSFKQEEHKSYYDRMREACKPPDTFPKHVSFFDIFDDY